MARSASIKTSFLIYLFSMFLMVSFFSQCFSERIQHSITKTVVRQQIMPFRPFIETSDSQNTGYLRVLVQIHERRLDKCLKGSRVLILKDSTCRPLAAIRLFRTTDRSNISRCRVPARSHCRNIRDIKLTMMLIPKFERYISRNSSVVRQFDFFG